MLACLCQDEASLDTSILYLELIWLLLGAHRASKTTPRLELLSLVLKLALLALHVVFVFLVLVREMGMRIGIPPISFPVVSLKGNRTVHSLSLLLAPGFRGFVLIFIGWPQKQAA